MNAERFEQLTAAYGAQPDRWPEGERAAALAFMEAEGRAAERILFEARMIDAALDASPAPAVGAELRARILASAPRPQPRAAPQPRPRAPRRAWFGFPDWAAAAGFAAACAVGMVSGAAVMQQVAADAQADAILADASELTIDEQEILG